MENQGKDSFDDFKYKNEIIKGNMQTEQDPEKVGGKKANANPLKLSLQAETKRYQSYQVIVEQSNGIGITFQGL